MVCFHMLLSLQKRTSTSFRGAILKEYLVFSGMNYELTLYVQCTKNKAVRKRLPFKLICAVYLEYVVIIHFVRPYPSLLTVHQDRSRQKVASV